MREAVSDQTAERVSGMKKLDMALEAEELLPGKRWLPSLLRGAVPVAREAQSEVASLTEQAA